MLEGSKITVNWEGKGARALQLNHNQFICYIAGNCHLANHMIFAGSESAGSSTALFSERHHIPSNYAWLATAIVYK